MRNTAVILVLLLSLNLAAQNARAPRPPKGTDEQLRATIANVFEEAKKALGEDVPPEVVPQYRAYLATREMSFYRADATQQMRTAFEEAAALSGEPSDRDANSRFRGIIKQQTEYAAILGLIAGKDLEAIS